MSLGMLSKSVGRTFLMLAIRVRRSSEVERRVLFELHREQAHLKPQFFSSAASRDACGWSENPSAASQLLSLEKEEWARKGVFTAIRQLLAGFDIANREEVEGQFIIVETVVRATFISHTHSTTLPSVLLTWADTHD
jgi:hypothetical protein